MDNNGRSLGRSRSTALSVGIVLIVITMVITILPRIQQRFSLTGRSDSGRKDSRGPGFFFIVGERFDPSFVGELRTVCSFLHSRTKISMVTIEGLEKVYRASLKQGGISISNCVSVPRGHPITFQFSTDVALALGGGRVAVSPNPNAALEQEVDDYLEVLERLYQDRYQLTLTPFLFEGTNLVFLAQGGKRILLVGKKIILDNEVYQRYPWAPGWDRKVLLRRMQDYFAVDTLLVLGGVESPPPPGFYFESHLDRAVAVLGDTAIVTGFPFTERERREVRKALERREPVVKSVLGTEYGLEEAYESLCRRLAFVSREYDHYALVLDSLGVEVVRSPATWRNIAGGMSWTSIVRIADRILMPLYPDTLKGSALPLGVENGVIKRKLNVREARDDLFPIEGPNLENLRLYRRMGYEVITVPEFAHYYDGSLRRLVNILG